MKIRFVMPLVLLSGAVMADETMYIQSAKAKLLQERSFTAPVVTEIDKGAAVNVSSVSGRWAQVSYQKNTGWISTLLLAKNPPLNKVSVLSDEKEMGNNTRRRASAVATAGATRGLTSDSRQRANENTNTNYRALMLVEQNRVSDSELASFREETQK